MSERITIGFGAPNGPDDIDPHHFTVEIPPGRSGEVVITERFGLKAGTLGLPQEIERCRLSRTAWAAIAEPAKRVLNERLKASGLRIGRWTPGENRVERLLGRELTLLAWAVEKAAADKMANAVRSWIALRPEERWWLFSMAAPYTGTSDDADIGWRKAIRIALTEAPSAEQMKLFRGELSRSKRMTPVIERPKLPLFED